MPPGEFRWKTLPAEIREFLSDPDSASARHQIRLFLPVSAEGLVLNLISFLGCALFAPFLITAGIFLIASSERDTLVGGLVTFSIGGLLAWGVVTSWMGLQVRLARYKGRRAQFGYWVVKSGILARNDPREIAYLPWEKITSIKETRLFEKSSESSSYTVYPALSVTIRDNGESLRYHFAGEYVEFVDESKIDRGLMNLHYYDLSGKDPSEFRMFKTAVAEFMAIQ